MKEKKARLKLEDIKIESFITSLDDNSAEALKGGTGGDGTNYTYQNQLTLCAQQPGCLSWGGTCGCPYTATTCATSPQMNCCVDGGVD